MCPAGEKQLKANGTDLVTRLCIPVQVDVSAAYGW